MKKIKILTLLLIPCMLASFLSDHSFDTVYAEEDRNTKTEITITSVEDWNELAKNCMEDDYSKGKSIKLSKDLIFSKNFEPIPYMAGEFDGNGYTISGLCLDEPASDMALFRYVSEEGIIKNLTVVADMKAQGTATYIGGIVSHNYGLLEQCVFEGTISGEDTIGGIVACNEESGVISQCTNRGSIISLQYAGGIAGTNYGCILECGNEGEINHLSDNASFQSSGGIAGYNHGMISDSENYGWVGYKHIGYNVGGIAGLEDGLIMNSVNYGNILGRKDVGGIAGQFTPFITVAYEELYLSTVTNSMDHITSLSNELAKEMASFEEMTMESVNEAIEESGTEIAEQTISAVTESEDLSGLKDRLGDIDTDMNARKERREAYSVNAQKSMDRIVSLTSQINREMTVIENATKAIEQKDADDVIVDISTTNQTDRSMGYILSCSNFGEIQSDSNAGGIAGTLDFDNTNNPETDVVRIGDLSLNLHATIQMVVEQCDNYGIVHVVNNQAAGITGYAAYGYLNNNRNMADISCENGGYAAGIAAKSSAPIESCQAHCVLTADSFVGGIAATADQVTNCVSIVDIKECREKSGAILACYTEECRSNYYVSDILGGMDGVSYRGRAEQIDITQMRELISLDPDFYDIKISFIADKELVDTIEVPYGGSISDNQIPEVPVNEEGLCGSWEIFEKTNIEHGFAVRAIYDSWVTVIATGEQLPRLLLEGKFYPGTELSVESLSVKDYSLDNSKTVAHDRFYVVSESIPEQETNTVRVYLDQKKDKKYAVILVDENGVMGRPITPKTDGRYLVFDSDGSSEFYILEVNEVYKPFLLCGIGLLVFLLFLLPLTVGIVSKKKGEREIEDRIRKHEERKNRK